MNNQLTERAADNIRILSLSMVERANSGHPGGAMGGADYINILFTEFLNFDPDDPTWPLRDRFFMDPGHMSPMLYSVQALFGKYTIDDLMNFRQYGSHTPGHPEYDLKRGVENTSGPLGQGHVNAIGAAIAERFLAARFGEVIAHRTFTYISDGGIQEEIAQGGGRIAGHLGLGNLIMFYDSNNIQLSTETKVVTSEDTAKKYEAWNWHVQTIPGNDTNAIRQALTNAIAEKERPSLIIGKTIMGYKAVGEDGTSKERLTSTHGQPLSKAGASVERTILNIGGDPKDPFKIFPEVKEFYSQVMDKERKGVAVRKAAFADWQKANPGQAVLWKQYQSGSAPAIDYSSIKIKPDNATRNTSGEVLEYFSKNVGNMIVMSADLSNSDKTEGFLKGSKALTKGDFTGGFLHIGVSELTMAALANGVALHGGVMVACGTFFVFSDFMKPSIRLAALMQIPVKYVFTHDAFRVGEDGPTHQPVEQEAQIRLLEHLKNHSGENSVLVLRPADAAETVIAWKMAMENTRTPTALILSRQNIKDVPTMPGSNRYQDALEAYKGAYIAKDSNGKPDVTLIANGSEVSTLIAGLPFLEEKGIKARVVSVISEGLFRKQDKTYQLSIIPEDIPHFGLTAGLPVNLLGLVGQNGKIFGLEHFGFSAPANVLDEKFGFTPVQVAQEVIAFLMR